MIKITDQLLQAILSRPAPFSHYTAEEFWNDPYISEKLLKLHLAENIDVASRNIDFIRRSVNWLKKQLNLGESSKILDLGCGPGLYTELFAHLGAKVTGIDFSEKSIQFAKNSAKKHHLEIDYFCEDFLKIGESLKKEKFDLITLIFCEWCALSPDQRKGMFRNFSQLLTENGQILLDVYSLKTFEESEEISQNQSNLMDSFWSPNNYHGFFNSYKYEDEKVVLEKYDIVEEKRHQTIYNWFQHYSPESIRLEFEENDFVIEEFYSDLAGTPYSKESPTIAILARKA